MVSTKLELPGDVQGQSFTSALEKSCSENFHKFSEKELSLTEFLFVKFLA